MNLFIKCFDELTTKELYEILKLRVDIFVVEQNCAYHELDGKDYESVHIFYKSEKEIVAYLRVFADDCDKSIVRIGRVISKYKKNGLGNMLMLNAITFIEEMKKYNKIFLEAQVYAIGFYEQFGFAIVGEKFLEDDIEHIGMEIIL
ncbi:ElaA protein [Peptoniphilus olsenii]|uniref:ElaA protein n=1 Tax=Peptoniphilus olsenii TaxID=411570 RepID=A0ABV2JBV9_9FIRM